MAKSTPQRRKKMQLQSAKLRLRVEIDDRRDKLRDVNTQLQAIALTTKPKKDTPI